MSEEPKRRDWPIQVFNSFEEAEEADRAYWRSTTVQQRLQALEQLRRMFYGTARATARIERVLTVHELDWS